MSRGRQPSLPIDPGSSDLGIQTDPLGKGPPGKGSATSPTLANKSRRPRRPFGARKGDVAALVSDSSLLLSRPSALARAPNSAHTDEGRPLFSPLSRDALELRLWRRIRAKRRTPVSLLREKKKGALIGQTPILGHSVVRSALASKQKRQTNLRKWSQHLQFTSTLRGNLTTE